MQAEVMKIVKQKKIRRRSARIRMIKKGQAQRKRKWENQEDISLISLNILLH